MANLAKISRENGLTPAFSSLLEVLINPEVRVLSVIDICKLAGISRDTYYRALKTPEFQDALRQATGEIALAKAPAVVNSMARKAEEGDVQAAKLVLETAGIHATMTVRHRHEVEVRTLRDILKARMREKQEKQEPAIDCEFTERSE